MAGKADIVDAIANDTGLTRKDAAAALDSVVNAIAGSLKKGERVALPGPRDLPRRRPQGARRREPPHEGGHPDRGREGRAVPGGQGPEGTPEQAPKVTLPVAVLRALIMRA